MQRLAKIAVFGASGAVGREIISVLGERNFPNEDIAAYASDASDGLEVDCGEGSVTVRALKHAVLDEAEVAVLCTPRGLSEGLKARLIEKNVIVIGVGSGPAAAIGELPVVPEVNADVLRDFMKDRTVGKPIVIANPQPAVAALCTVLAPLAQTVGLERVVATVALSASYLGRKGMDELWQQSIALFSQGDVEPKVFPRQIAFNCVPHVSLFDDNGYTLAENAIAEESKRILNLEELKITATAVFLPVFCCDGISLNVTLSDKFSALQARELLQRSPGLVVLDDPKAREYPHAQEVAGNDAVYVGRIREDASAKNGLNLWCMCDGLRKGTAVNVVEIIEIILGK